MKKLFLFLSVVSFLNAQNTPKVEAAEMQRISSIIKDIAKLRKDYKICQTNLDAKDTILNAELDFKKDLTSSNKSLSSRVEELEKLVLDQNKIIKTKDNIILNLTKKSKNGTIKPTITLEKCEDKNKFPKLAMKDNKDNVEKIINFKAASFKLKMDSSLYDSVNGKKIKEWTKDTSFTSSKKTKNWIQVSGYFVNGKWNSAKDNMWIKLDHVLKK